MQHGFLKVAVATPSVRVADCPANERAILARIAEARKDGAKLLSLPELCITGYTCSDLFMQRALTDAALCSLERIVAETKGDDMLVVCGAPLVVNHELYNCAVVIQKGSVLGVVPKSHLPNYGEFYEKRIFAPAPDRNTEIPLFGCRVPFGNRLLFACENMPEFVLGIEVCEDLWSPIPPSAFLASFGATVICNLSASDEAVTKAAYRRTLVSSQSARQTCAYLFCSAGEGESTTDVVFGGHDMIVENGSMLAEALPFGDGYAASELDLAFLSRERRRHVKGGELNEDCVTVPFTLNMEETRLTREYWKNPFVPTDETEQAARAEEILSIQANGLKKRLQHTHAACAVIGVSGGLDSALALIVAREAFRLLGRPATDVHAVTMPCFGTSHRTRSNAEKLCDALGVPCRTIDISKAVRTHLQDIGHSLEQTDTAYENAQARERTQVLMDLANMENGLVIGTGDLSELALGFATYNGDHMSMYGVNAGVPKTMIRCMLRHFAQKNGGALKSVLLDIVATPVSPELLPGKDGAIAQITEDLVGPYELHDFFLYHMLRRGETPGKIARLARYTFRGDYDDATIARWLDVFLRRFFAQQFKRSCLPDGPRVGNVSLSPRGDWRMPSDAVADVWRM